MIDKSYIEYNGKRNVAQCKGLVKALREFFQRLQAGLPLTSSEKLNAVHSQLRNFCAKLAKHDFFATSTTVVNRRLAYFDICTKVLAVEIEGLDTGLRFDDVKQVFVTNLTFSSSSAVARRCKWSLDLLLKAFPEPNAALRQRSMVQSVISLVAHLKRAGLPESQAPLLQAFIESFSAELLHHIELGQAATDADYLAFQRTVNANTKSGAQIRHAILLRKLFAKHPDLFSSMGKTKELDGSLTTAINRDADEIRDLVKNNNDAYAAEHGCDLFKLTNKTLPAMTALHADLTSFDDYKNWVDNLYFVFRESVGQRLGSNFPVTFHDVNSLRTQLQHDVDHGKGAAAKRKKLAAVFEKYSGDTNPETLPPERFHLIQANVLAALVADLRILSTSIT